MMSDHHPPVWLITGCSRGLGLAFARAALGAGGRVVATARQTETLDALRLEYGERLLATQLDVTDPGQVDDAVRTAVDTFGRIDVLVNNAGYGLLGGVEEISEADARAQLETNFFGALWLTRAVLPVMRRQQAGHIVQISTIGGVASFPGLGMYHASKWALEGLSEALAAEVAAFGVRVTIVEPGSFRTDWGGPSMQRAHPLRAYDSALADTRAMFSGASSGQEPGDPARAAEILIQLVAALNRRCASYWATRRMSLSPVFPELGCGPGKTTKHWRAQPTSRPALSIDMRLWGAAGPPSRTSSPLPISVASPRRDRTPTGR